MAVRRFNVDATPVGLGIHRDLIPQGCANPGLENEIPVGFLEGDSRPGLRFLGHAGRELNVEVFDRKFTGDEARKKKFRLRSLSPFCVCKRF